MRDQAVLTMTVRSTARCRPLQAGFSLVESLVATAILLIAVSGVLTLFPQAYSSTHDSEHITQLSEIAAAKLDELRMLDDADPLLAPGMHPAATRDDANRYYYPVPGMSQAYSLRWVVEAGPTDGSGAAVGGMKRVSVQATYQVRYLRIGIVLRRLLQPNSREVVFTTLLTNDE